MPYYEGRSAFDTFSIPGEPVSAATGTFYRTFIPVWKQAPEYWTGVVASNFGDSAFHLDLAAWGSSGELEDLGRNPASLQIEPGFQKSLLGSEFFEGNPWNSDLSWIEMGTEGSHRMGSIFLFGESGTRMMDGAEAQPDYARKLYLTRPLDEGFFQGWNPDIQVSLVNPTAEEATLRCTLRGSNGTKEETHVIPSRGFLSGNIDELVGSGHGIVNGYLEIEVTAGQGIIGFSRIEFPGIKTGLGMNAVQATSSRKFYSAQLAHGLNIVTSLRLVNTSEMARKVIMSAIGDDGGNLAFPVSVDVAGRSIYSADLGTVFSLAGEGGVTTGSLVIEADGNGIIGDIIFANGDTLEYAMSLPLQDRLFTEAVFNHISNLPTVFTGFAFFNPGNDTAEVTIVAIGTDGNVVAGKTLVLGPGERIARTLTDPDIWPEFPTQSGGYIKIQSTRPIAGQQLFGDKSLRYMAAIPPTTKLEPMFE